MLAECILIVLVIVLIYYAWDELVNKESESSAEESFVSGHGLATQEYKQKPEVEGLKGATLAHGTKLLTGEDPNNTVESLLKEAYGDGEGDNYGDEEAKLINECASSDLSLDDSYNSYLVSSQLDEGTLASHQQFVYDQHRLRSKGGTASHHTIFTPADPVPWVGLRRPDYSTASSDYNTRMGQEYSVRSSQLQQQQPNLLGI